MRVYVNDKSVELSEVLPTVESLLQAENIPAKGTAIAVNGVFVPRDKWNSHGLKNEDRVMVISAAYGG